MVISPTRDTTSPIILFAIIAFGFIAGYFCYTSFLQDKPSVIYDVNVRTDANLAKLRDLKLDFSGLDNPTFKTLKIFGDLPVQPGSTGRVDIFAPF